MLKNLITLAIFLSGSLAIAPLIRSATTEAPAPAPKAKQKTIIYKVPVVKIVDGDTFDVQRAPDLVARIRMACIDAPEKAQKPFGSEATQSLSKMIFGKVVRIEEVGNDRGRAIGKVYLNEEFINTTLVAQGHAVVYRKYLKPCPDHEQSLLDAEAEAKLRRRGFWNQGKPIMPWDWRNGVRS